MRSGSFLRHLRAPLCLVAALAACAHTKEEANPARFATPEAAVHALVEAARSTDPDALLSPLGAEASPLVHSGDAVADRLLLEGFVRLADEGQRLSHAGPHRLTLEVGPQRWPFPIPLVRAEGGWSFDVEAGREEIVARRIGRNERSAIQSCLAYVDAQHEYFARNPEGDALQHYALRLASSPGRRDGLYWATAPGERPSPLGALFAAARAEGYTLGGESRAPYHGYYYRALTAQGPHAKGGAYDYIAHGFLFGGFALVSWPAEYGNSGVMTFIVNHDGVVFQKDLGPDTAKRVASMQSFDPGSGWVPVSPD